MDGIVCLFPKEKDDVYYKTCHEWEEIVGNTKLGKLEYTDFKALYQESVNCYVAVKTDGKAKIKGRLDYESELNKNNTKDLGRVERKAISEYFSKNIPIEETIMNEKNIFMFCIGLKSSSNYFFKTVHPKTAIETEYKKVIRFFISNNGERLLKIKAKDADTDGPDISRISKTSLVTMFNDKFDVQSFEEYNINYSFYIEKAKEIVEQIESARKNKKFVKADKNQISLF